MHHSTSGTAEELAAPIAGVAGFVVFAGLAMEQIIGFVKIVYTPTINQYFGVDPVSQMHLHLASRNPQRLS